DELERALQLVPFSSLRQRSLDFPDAPTPEELVDSRYAQTFGLHEQLYKHLGWSPTLRPAGGFAYVEYADQIYQAFVALALARVFETPRIGMSLMPGLDGPSFLSDHFEIYYDTKPPCTFVNWRDGSSRPSAMHPDITIVERATGRGVIIEAKY